MCPPDKLHHTDGGFVGCDDSAHREEQCGALDLHEVQHRWRSHIVCAKHNTVCRRQPRFVSAYWKRCSRFARNDVDRQRPNAVVSLRTQTQKETLPKRKCFFLELITGFEPVTSSLPRTCSTAWAISAHIQNARVIIQAFQPFVKINKRKPLCPDRVPWKFIKPK